MPGTTLTHHPIGIDEIDAEHDLLAEEIIAIECGLDEPQERILSVLALARRHFAHEEEHMLASGYPYFAEHRAEHTRLVVQLSDLCRSVHCMRPGSLAPTLLSWFSMHAETADRAYGRWLL